jgi:hypothetical protein
VKNFLIVTVCIIILLLVATTDGAEAWRKGYNRSAFFWLTILCLPLGVTATFLLPVRHAVLAQRRAAQSQEPAPPLAR